MGHSRHEFFSTDRDVYMLCRERGGVGSSNSGRVGRSQCIRDVVPIDTTLYLIQARGQVTNKFRALIASFLGRNSMLQYIPSDTLLVRTTILKVQLLSTVEEVP